MQWNAIVILVVFCIPNYVFSQTDPHPLISPAVTMIEIPTNIGSLFQLQEGLFQKVNSGNNSELYKVDNVRVGNIDPCIMIFETVEDTIVSITLLLTGEKTREQARQQADKQFGTARFEQNQMMSAYGWLHETQGGKISISLAFTPHEPTSEMFIKKME